LLPWTAVLRRAPEPPRVQALLRLPALRRRVLVSLLAPERFGVP